jgi:hypothetical protein
MDLTKELEFHFDLAKKNGRLPKWQTTRNKFGLSEAEVKTAQDLWRKKHGERVRGAELPEEYEETPQPEKEKWYETLAKAFDWVVDKGTVFIAVALALVLCAFSLWIMGPSDFEKVGFVALAFVIVLFGYRALVKKVMWLWVICEIVAGILGVSFVLTGLDYQTNLTADDRQLTALETAETNAEDYLATLQALQADKGEGYKSQIEAQQRVFDEASAKAGEYRVQVENKPKKAPEIKAYDILLAIPKAILGSGAKLTNDMAMWIALGLFGTVFFILPATLYTTVRRKD